MATTTSTTIEMPKSPVAARRTSPRRDQSSSPNVHRRMGGDYVNTRAMSPTALRSRNISPVPTTENETATPVLPHVRNRRDLTVEEEYNHTPEAPSQPLLENDTTFHPLPPLAGPEIDDLDERNGSIPLQPQSGVDNGLLETGIIITDSDLPDKTTEKVDPNTGEYDPNKDPEIGPNPEFPDDGNYDTAMLWHADDVTDYGGGIPNGLAPRAGTDDVPFPYPPELIPGAEPRIIPDVNVYQQKKNLAQGMMDLALFSANANQLRYVWESYDNHPYFYPSVVFIVMSLLLQIGVGVGLIWNSRYNVKNHDHICIADKINNLTVIGIFLITIVNVFIASFGVASRPQMITVIGTNVGAPLPVTAIGP